MSKQAHHQEDGARRVAGLVHEHFSRLTRQLRHVDLPAGMTPERLSTLSAIQKRSPISVTALADTEMVRPATMSRMVSALVNDGLARRLEDKTDGRGVLVAATSKGRRAYERAHQIRLQQLSDALSSFSPEQLASMEKLVLALEHLTSALDE